VTYVADDHPEAHAEYLQAVAFYDGKASDSATS